MGKRIFLVLIGTGLSFIGAIFIWLMARSYLQALSTRAWIATSATVLQAEITERQIGPSVPRDYAASVLYGYDYADQRFTSDKISIRGHKWFKDSEKAQKELGNLSPGAISTCWVNPENPTQSVLKHDSKAAGYSIWFPSIFFIGGIGVIIGAFRKT